MKFTIADTVEPPEGQDCPEITLARSDTERPICGYPYDSSSEREDQLRNARREAQKLAGRIRRVGGSVEIIERL